MNTLKNKLFAAGLLLASSSFVCNFLSATSAPTPLEKDVLEIVDELERTYEDYKRKEEYLLCLLTDVESRLVLAPVQFSMENPDKRTPAPKDNELLIEKKSVIEKNLHAVGLLIIENRKKYNDFNLRLAAMTTEEEGRKSEEMMGDLKTMELELNLVYNRGAREVSLGDSDTVYMFAQEDKLSITVSGNSRPEDFTAPDPSLVCQYKIEDYRGCQVDDPRLKGWQDAEEIDLSDESGVRHHKALFTVPSGSFKISFSIYNKKTDERGTIYTSDKSFISSGSRY